MPNKRKYMKINRQTRENLIKLVEEDKIHIKDAAIELGLKESTARSIYQKYIETGEIFEKKEMKLSRVAQEEPERNEDGNQRNLP